MSTYVHCIGTQVMAHIYKHIHTIHMYTHNVHTQTQHTHRYTHTHKQTKNKQHVDAHMVQTHKQCRHTNSAHTQTQTHTHMLTVKVQQNPLITNYFEVQLQATCMMRFWKPHYQNLNWEISTSHQVENLHNFLFSPKTTEDLFPPIFFFF